MTLTFKCSSCGRELPVRPEDAAVEEAAARARFGCDPAAEPERFAKVCDDCAAAIAGIRAIGVPAGLMIPEPGVITIAVITLSEQVNIGWLPEMFARPIPAALRAEIVERLRFCADKWESGAMEARMGAYLAAGHVPEGWIN